jgi:hypothetical protein
MVILVTINVGIDLSRTRKENFNVPGGVAGKTRCASII